ncbi:hypothetical protein UFOVP54_66 [uncultured Caudovirales phage]|uniref:Uncharacterized protein n=1 Tax=uncultured Caudovirales phage TaxID=2100421 RepID=A0A6J5KW72_9CAUD|nr:hypothetical protein UFOVP54_66 [uncultured Caudovirales phage]
MKESILRDKPYYELKTFDFIYRKFTQDIDEQELVWHRDREDREVTVLGDTDWQFQLEDSIPQQLQDTIFIPKNTYHRLIKGTGDLDIRILEL